MTPEHVHNAILLIMPMKGGAVVELYIRPIRSWMLDCVCFNLPRNIRMNTMNSASRKMRAK